MKRVVSVSLGSPERDKIVQVSIKGQEFSVERRGVGGSYVDYARALSELDQDPTVSAIGLGGINLYLFSGSRRYPLKKAQQLISVVHHKPVCDGSRLKELWEPYVVRQAAENGDLEFSRPCSLVVSVADRWGMAQALEEWGSQVIVGDLMFALGIPIPIGSLASAGRITRALLPLVTQVVPFEWLYPTGESRDRPGYHHWYRWADIIAGDWKFIKKYLPKEGWALSGKIVITNTVTPKDLELLRARDCQSLLTTTPELDGRCFGTNVMEALATVVSGLPPEEMNLPDYQEIFRYLGYDKPKMQVL